MAASSLFTSSSSAVSSQSVFLPKLKTGLVWRMLFAMLIMVIVGVHSQTFQYSRGWTNGKRSGDVSGSSSGSNNNGFRAGDWSRPVFDVDNGVVGPLDQDPSVPVPVHMNLGRPSFDYNQEIGWEFNQSKATAAALDRNSNGNGIIK